MTGRTFRGVTVIYGVPQRSVLRPLLSVLDAADVTAETDTYIRVQYHNQNSNP